MASYSAPEKKEKKKKGEKKEAREGLHQSGLPDSKSEETHASSTHEEEHKDEGECGSPLTRKRAASADAAEDLPPLAPKRTCRTKAVLVDDNSDSDKESENFERVP